MPHPFSKEPEPMTKWGVFWLIFWLLFLFCLVAAGLVALHVIAADAMSLIEASQ